MCGLKKYRQKMTNADGTCAPNDQFKLNTLQLKIAELTLAISQPNCGIDIEELNAEIRKELIGNDCYCDDCGKTGNNLVAGGLGCDEIDITCVWHKITELINSSPAQKEAFCQLVNECTGSQTSCDKPLMSGAVFKTNKIIVNFILQNTAQSNNLVVEYKLNSSNTWITAATLPNNATHYEILGNFTENETYDVRVINKCSGGENSSAIVSGVVVEEFGLCSLLNMLYGGLGNGVYAIKKDTRETGCNQYSYQELNTNYIQTLLPCNPPINFNVSSNGVLTWDGAPGTYEISYKPKTSGTWTVYSTANYTGTSHTLNILPALGTNPVVDFDFRIIMICTTGNTLPVYTSLQQSQITPCESAVTLYRSTKQQTVIMGG
jgi:hypothetical protein